eukprot:scaffold14529_cov60-Phaeocystis_antarctica.AAC.3
MNSTAQHRLRGSCRSREGSFGWEWAQRGEAWRCLHVTGKGPAYKAKSGSRSVDKGVSTFRERERMSEEAGVGLASPALLQSFRARDASAG